MWTRADAPVVCTTIRKALLGLATTAFLAPAATHPALAQSGEEIARTALERYAERVSGVDDYTVVQEVMGEEVTLHFEKEMEDGFPTFVPVSTFTVLQERVDAHRSSFMAAAMTAGLGSLVESELSAASPGQIGEFLGTAEELGVQVLGGGAETAGGAGGPGEAAAGAAAAGVGAAAAGDSPVDAVRDILVRSAARAGLEKLGGAVGGATAEQIAELAGGLMGLGDQNILGQLGQIALGELKGLALDRLAGALGGPVGALAGQALSGGGLGGIASALGAAAPGGLGGLLGGAAPGGMAAAGGAGIAGAMGGGGLASVLGGAAAGPGGLAAGVGMQALGGLAQAGLGALMGGLGGVMAGAMTPDMSQFDRAMGRTMGPDPYALMASVAPHARVEGSEKMAGHEVWVLTVDDLSAVELPDAEDFTPDGIMLHVDKELYVLRRATVSGEVRAEGEMVPVSLETRLADYRDAGSGLIYPFRTVTVVQGMGATLSEKERAQLEQMGPMMREQMEKMMEELEKMPPEQREMAEQMMLQQMPQMEMMMKQMQAMAGEESGGITVQVLELRVNEGRPESLQISIPRPG